MNISKKNNTLLVQRYISLYNVQFCMLSLVIFPFDDEHILTRMDRTITTAVTAPQSNKCQ